MVKWSHRVLRIGINIFLDKLIGIVISNGSLSLWGQFLITLYKKLGTQSRYSSMCHPQTDG